ncbi:ribonuclease Z [Anaeromyxobacter diazotrophicus]|uniref:Ribonuclease Z n=1 Tax=Anaeromyxobacter diazotrophicus TaxID=2590199 RepID=A0A7I9VQ06_9BACT|nr:ribonuclease Z [Anaeromyxobacter diazotrophicus]GEJ58475.1 ribonuclease Z [Anaeromyxobacter diazotrophicus]
MLRVTFLGTSAAQPTASRGLSATAVRHAGELLLFDCGEGTQRQMIRYATGFDVAAIFFTHFHADHYLGAIGFLRTLSMLGRTAPLHLYGPRPAERLLQVMLFTGTDVLAFPIEIHEIAAGAVVRRPGAEIHAFATQHRTPSLGYALREDARPGRFHPDRALALGVPPGPLFGRLQRGEAVAAGGRTVRPEEVLDAPRRGRALVITGDTRPAAATAEAARGADLLVHDATFGDEEQGRAEETWHSTAREAARVARDARAGRLVLTHLSTRYDQDPSPLVRQAREEWPAVDVAHDGLVLELPLPD